MDGQLPNFENFLTALQSGAQDAAARVADAVRDVTPVKSGQLADSLEGESEATAEGATLSVVSDVPQARYVLEGTAAHPIDPVTARALMWPEADHPYAHVDHPGTQANPFYEAAVDGIDTAVDDLLETALGAL